MNWSSGFLVRINRKKLITSRQIIFLPQHEYSRKRDIIILQFVYFVCIYIIEKELMGILSLRIFSFCVPPVGSVLLIWPCVPAKMEAFQRVHRPMYSIEIDSTLGSSSMKHFLTDRRVQLINNLFKTHVRFIISDQRRLTFELYLSHRIKTFQTINPIESPRKEKKKQNPYKKTFFCFFISFWLLGVFRDFIHMNSLSCKGLPFLLDALFFSWHARLKIADICHHSHRPSLISTSFAICHPHTFYHWQIVLKLPIF